MSWQDGWMIILAIILAMPLVATAGFAYWLRRHPNIDLETGVKCWDVFVKLISAFTVVVSGAAIFAKYMHELQAGQQHEIAVRQAESLKHQLLFDMERHQRKRLLFEEAKTVAVGLTHSDSDAPDRESLRRFDELYFGSLVGVEKSHGEVEAAMVRFRKKLMKDPQAPDDSLKQLSLQLSQACKAELDESEAVLVELNKKLAGNKSVAGTGK